MLSSSYRRRSRWSGNHPCSSDYYSLGIIFICHPYKFVRSSVAGSSCSSNEAYPAVRHAQRGASTLECGETSKYRFTSRVCAPSDPTS